MVMIYTDGGSFWRDDPPEREPKRPTARRFAVLAVGDQLMRDEVFLDRRRRSYFVVTDLWDDPVAGQHNPSKGAMVGYAPFRRGGALGDKEAKSRLGLASSGFHKADMDYAAFVAARQEAAKAEPEKVVGIGRAHAIRRKPKVARPSL